MPELILSLAEKLEAGFSQIRRSFFGFGFLSYFPGFLIFFKFISVCGCLIILNKFDKIAKYALYEIDELPFLKITTGNCSDDKKLMNF